MINTTPNSHSYLQPSSKQESGFSQSPGNRGKYNPCHPNTFQTGCTKQYDGCLSRRTEIHCLDKNRNPREPSRGHQGRNPIRHKYRNVGQVSIQRP
jgi:hypothetical protein